MSTARLALRFAAVEALRPALAVAVGGPYPTLAGALVYDSRINLLEGDERVAAELENKPVVIVYTEDDTTETIDDQVKYPADVPIVELTVEIMIASTGVIEIENADGSKTQEGIIQAPASDAQHEAILDFLEAQVIRLLGKRAYEDRLASSKLFNSVAMEIRRIKSDPKRSADSAARLAARTITFHVKPKSEKWPLDLAPGQSAPTGFNLLPEPLRTVALGLPQSSYAYEICQTLVGLAHVPTLRQPLSEVHAFLGMQRTPTKGDGTDSDVQADVAL